MTSGLNAVESEGSPFIVNKNGLAAVTGWLSGNEFWYPCYDVIVTAWSACYSPVTTGWTASYAPVTTTWSPT